MASRASSQDLLVGVELGHCRIVEKIGAGGMGDVYRARDEHLARDVAIKVLPPGTLIDESARKHFHKALILSQLNHPNVATIHDFDTQQRVDFLVMQHIPGDHTQREAGCRAAAGRDRSAPGRRGLGEARGVIPMALLHHEDCLTFTLQPRPSSGEVHAGQTQPKGAP